MHEPLPLPPSSQLDPPPARGVSSTAARPCCLLAGILIGAGRQGLAAPFIFLAYWVVGIPLGAYLALGPPALGLPGLWVGLLVGEGLHDLSFVALVLLIRWDVVAKEASS